MAVGRQKEQVDGSCNSWDKRFNVSELAHLLPSLRVTIL